MTDININQLLSQCAQGDRSALSAIYDHESARLLGLINAIVRNKAVAEDILHDLFIRVWMKAHKFTAKDGNGSAWLSRMARNLALNAVRYNWRDSSLSDDAKVLEIDEVLSQLGEDESFRLSTENQRLVNCLNQIEPEPRAAIVSAYVHGLSHSELTKHLSAPLGTIKAWIKRSLHKLRECMS